MGRFNSCLGLNVICVCFAALLLFNAGFVKDVEALTIAYGQPYHGRLINGVQFPNQFPGYHLRDPERSYTSPEVVGALLDAIDAVRQKFPDTCDVLLADFSTNNGGGAIHHRSHQNGRDVDVGMYARGNRPLDNLMVMNEENLDAAKTWCLIENIIASQRVQYIFLDRRIQKILYDYAVSQGTDPAYLDHVFGNVQGSLIQHVPNHIDHFHVRFFTPWSTLAGHVGENEHQKRMVIEMAQQAYLPQKVNYYVEGNEKSLDALAQSFGVTQRELCRWNQIAGGNMLQPGSCLVFYKRGFEAEPVHLAQSLQPGFVVETPPIQYASLRSNSVLSDAPSVAEENLSPAPVRQKRTSAPATPTYTTYKIQKGDTLEKVARKNHLDVKALCQLNGMKKPTALKPGQTIRLAMVKPSAGQAAFAGSSVPKGRSIRNLSISSDQRNCSIAAASYKVSKGDTLQKISRRTGIGIDVLCQMNGLKKNSELKPGQAIKLAQATSKSCVVTSGQSKSQSPARNQPASRNKQVSNSKSAAPSKAANGVKGKAGPAQAPAKAAAVSKTSVVSKTPAASGSKAQAKSAVSSKPAAASSKPKAAVSAGQKKDTKSPAAATNGKPGKGNGKLARDASAQSGKKKVN